MHCAQSALDADQKHSTRRGSQTLAEQYPADKEMRTISETCPVGGAVTTPHAALTSRDLIGQTDGITMERLAVDTVRGLDIQKKFRKKPTPRWWRSRTG
jgi:hypothetical protein